MAVSDLVNLSGLMDDAKCFAFVRQRRWPEGIRCPACDNDAVIRDGCDDMQPCRQRYRCKACSGRFDDLTGTVLAGHHQPLRVWVLCLYFMGPNRQIALELGLDTSDTQAMTEQLRRGLVARTPAVGLQGEVEPDARASSGIDEVYVVAGHKGQPDEVAKRGGSDGAASWQARRAAARWKRTSRPSSAWSSVAARWSCICWPMCSKGRSSLVITAAVAPGALIHTDEYSIYARLPAWGYGHKTVCHGRGEYPRDENGDGFCEVHVNTMEGFWSLLRSWLRPHRGISQDKLPDYIGFFQFVHNARRPAKPCSAPSLQLW